jgi:hypothetical protein
MLSRARANYTDGNQAAMWVARRIAGDTRPFADFQPLVLVAEWAVVASDVDPPAQTPSPSASEA